MPRNGCAASAVGGDGCIYPDEVIMEKGIAFNVRYTGCIEVKSSMKSLDFPTRTQVARECINRVCEAAGLKSVSKRRGEKKIQPLIAERPCMHNAGANVIINVSSRELTLLHADSGEVLLSHAMPRISFASGGDADTLDFLAYVAKSEDEWRACYVLECIGGQSEDLIVTIGKAFMLRYNALNQRTYQPAENYNRGKENDKDYYNDLPNKLPPDLLTETSALPVASTAQQQPQQQEHLPAAQVHKLSQLNLRKSRDRLSSNLIDLNSPPADQTTSRLNLSQFDPMREPSTAAITTEYSAHDVFDMPHFSLSAEVQHSQLMTEAWFHGAIGRPVSEALLNSDGDFLVRESQGKHNQYVLTGLEGQTPKHLLLIDPEGVVRTKDRFFDSISHLINYHWNNALPIISEDSELVLRNPVIRKQQKQPPAIGGVSAATGGVTTGAVAKQHQAHTAAGVSF